MLLSLPLSWESDNCITPAAGDLILLFFSEQCVLCWRLRAPGQGEGPGCLQGSCVGGRRFGRAPTPQYRDQQLQAWARPQQSGWRSLSNSLRARGGRSPCSLLGWWALSPHGPWGCSPGEEVGVICRFQAGALGLGRSSLTLIILDGGHPISRRFGESLLCDR